MMTYFLEKLGFRWTLRIWSAMLLVFGGLAVLGTKPRLPVTPTSRTGAEVPLNLSFLASPLFISVVSLNLIIWCWGFWDMTLTLTCSLH